MDAIADYLDDYQDQWWDQDIEYEYYVGDVGMNIIDEEDYYGCDMSGDQRVIMMFFVGHSDCFPAIWIGNDDMSRLDEMPIYILDLSSDEHEFEPVGNFKQHMMVALNSMPDGEIKQQAIKGLDAFSDNMIDKGNYMKK